MLSFNIFCKGQPCTFIHLCIQHCHPSSVYPGKGSGSMKDRAQCRHLAMAIVLITAGSLLGSRKNLVTVSMSLCIVIRAGSCTVGSGLWSIMMCRTGELGTHQSVVEQYHPQHLASAKQCTVQSPDTFVSCLSSQQDMHIHSILAIIVADLMTKGTTS